MRLHLPGGVLRRADADVSDITSAERTGPAYWDPDEPDVLVVPMDPEPTLAEQAAIQRRFTIETPVEETLHARAEQAYQQLLAFENTATPTNAQVVTTVRLLCRVVRALIRLQLRHLDAAD